MTQLPYQTILKARIKTALENVFNQHVASLLSQSTYADKLRITNIKANEDDSFSLVILTTDTHKDTDKYTIDTQLVFLGNGVVLGQMTTPTMSSEKELKVREQRYSPGNLLSVPYENYLELVEFATYLESSLDTISSETVSISKSE